jgi:hypothetical protein
LLTQSLYSDISLKTESGHNGKLSFAEKIQFRGSRIKVSVLNGTFLEEGKNRSLRFRHWQVSLYKDKNVVD